MTSIDGYCHYWDGTISGFASFCRRLAKVDPSAYSKTIGTQVENSESKRIERVISKNVGLPKGPKTYGNGVAIVPDCSPLAFSRGARYGRPNSLRKGSVTVYLICNRSQYSTGCTTLKDADASHQRSLPSKTTSLINLDDNLLSTQAASESHVLNKLQSLKKRAESFPNLPIDRDLMQILCQPEFLMMAYDNIKSKPGNMTPGVTPETLDGINKEWFYNISTKLKSEQLSFKPARRIQIPKASGGTRPLSIASPREKILQEGIRIILEIIFEPTFHETSHGFRTQRSCHSALKEFYNNFKHTQ
jgi:hypothetical protein